jgi:hypothetical protein
LRSTGRRVPEIEYQAQRKEETAPSRRSQFPDGSAFAARVKGHHCVMPFQVLSERRRDKKADPKGGLRSKFEPPWRNVWPSGSASIRARALLKVSPHGASTVGSNLAWVTRHER